MYTLQKLRSRQIPPRWINKIKFGSIKTNSEKLTRPTICDDQNSTATQSKLTATQLARTSPARRFKTWHRPSSASSRRQRRSGGSRRNRHADRLACRTIATGTSRTYGRARTCARRTR